MSFNKGYLVFSSWFGGGGRGKATPLPFSLSPVRWISNNTEIVDLLISLGKPKLNLNRVNSYPINRHNLLLYEDLPRASSCSTIPKTIVRVSYLITMADQGYRSWSQAEIKINFVQVPEHIEVLEFYAHSSLRTCVGVRIRVYRKWMQILRWHDS